MTVHLNAAGYEALRERSREFSLTGQRERGCPDPIYDDRKGKWDWYCRQHSLTGIKCNNVAVLRERVLEWTTAAVTIEYASRYTGV
ncbi:MAG TPA: hypothetical protein PKH75_14270 [Bacillota bacterium]|nr:hypothetical protein [Bacillota bacterium]